MCVLTEEEEERVLLSHNSHVATATQVRHCLGMQPVMQAHSAPADCGSRDVIDLCCSANRASLIYIAALAPWLMPVSVPANIRQRALYTGQAPATANLKDFTSVLTAWPLLLTAIITGFLWASFKNCFPSVSLLLCCEQWTWYLGQTTTIQLFRQYTVADSLICICVGAWERTLSFV